jgi:hypothetical protein
LPEVRHGLFRRSNLLFLLAEFVRECDEESPVTLPLVRWESKDAGCEERNVREKLTASENE